MIFADVWKMINTSSPNCHKHGGILLYLIGFFAVKLSNFRCLWRKRATRRLYHRNVALIGTFVKTLSCHRVLYNL